MLSDENKTIEQLLSDLAEMRRRLAELGRTDAERAQMVQQLQESEERYQDLYEEAPVAYYSVDTDTRIRMANHSAEKLVGYQRYELIGRSVFDLYADTAAGRPKAQELFQRFLSGERIQNVELEMVKKDGTQVWINLTVQPIKDTSGKIVATRSIAVDITERKRAEEALRESEERYKTLTEDAPIGIYFSDFGGTFLYGNKMAEEIVGYAREELLGKSFLKLKLLEPKELGKAVKLLALNKLGKATGPDNFVLNRKDGFKRSVEISTKVITISGKKVVLGMVDDITERKRAEEALRESEAFNSLLFDSIGDFLTVQDTEYNIIRINESMERIFGKDVVGKKCYQVYHDRKEVCPGCAMTKVLATGKPAFNAERQIQGDVVVEIQAFPVKDEHGNVFAMIEHGRNITERKRAEGALKESEEKFSRAFHSSPHPMVIGTVPEGHSIEVNDSFIQTFGYRRDEVIGKTVDELGLWAVPEKRARLLTIMQEQGKVRDFEAELRAKSGEIVTVLISSGRLNIGGQLCSLAVLTDITERKQAEELTRTLADSSPIGVYILQDGKFVYANPQFQEDSGYSEEELLSSKGVEFVIPEDRDTVRENAISMLKGERTTAYEYRAVTKSGEIRWALETVASIQYRGRRATLGNYIDITERKRAEERERRLHQELYISGRLASVGKLAAGVAHEINNPLTGILGFSERLLRKGADEESKRDLKRINDEARRASRVVQNLLAFARRRELKKERLDVNNIVLKALELRAYELKTSNIEVVTDLVSSLPKVVADFEQIEEVFLNLILNAEQAMTGIKNGGKLTVKTVRIKDCVRISFTDDGPGIPAENLDKLFDPFFTTRGEKGGTGLGLSVCHGIVEEHGGRIYAESEVGKGATLFVELPLATKKG